LPFYKRRGDGDIACPQAMNRLGEIENFFQPVPIPPLLVGIKFLSKDFPTTQSEGMMGFTSPKDYLTSLVSPNGEDRLMKFINS
jgi:hypothetical protein